MLVLNIIMQIDNATQVKLGTNIDKDKDFTKCKQMHDVTLGTKLVSKWRKQYVVANTECL